ncbi:MAG: Hint domain-containing protein [Paracoccaceae bacterium]
MSNPPNPNAPNPHLGSAYNTFKNGNHRAGPNEDGVFCFGEGTLIATPGGETAVEDLAIGDMVNTLDSGAQAIRWIGSTTVTATGANQPVRIAVDAFGKAQPLTALIVSPAHRMLVDSILASLLFECPQLLAHAKDLINDSTIRPVTGKQFVRYFHFMFDKHELVWANGAVSESFHPSQASDNAATHASLAELQRLFPNTFLAGGELPSARPTLSALEARLLMR